MDRGQRQKVSFSTNTSFVHPETPSSAGRNDTFAIDTSNVLFILSGAFVGLDSIIKRRTAKGVRAAIMCKRADT